MKILFNYCVAAGLAIACFSCNNGQDNSVKDAKDSNAVKMDSSAAARDTSSNASATATASVPATVSKDDAQFMVNTANAGMTEVQAGQLAEQKGMGKDVKAYGAMMVKDHTAAGDKLKALAATKNITLPAAISPEMQKNLDDLQKKDGADFDKAYMNMMVDDHKKVISMFEDESKKGSDGDIRSFADNTLHTLRMHLDKAEECKKMMKGGM